MKKREERRYLTHKYQQRQVCLAYSLSYTKPHDYSRRLRRKVAIKQRFIDDLAGVCAVDPATHKEWEVDYLTKAMLGYPYEFSQERLGHLRNHSWARCSRVRCPSCSNPRRGYGWDSGKQLLTRPERIAELNYEEDLALYYCGEYDDLLSH